jgi:hypothetical protein
VQVTRGKLMLPSLYWQVQRGAITSQASGHEPRAENVPTTILFNVPRAPRGQTIVLFSTMGLSSRP